MRGSKLLAVSLDHNFRWNWPRFVAEHRANTTFWVVGQSRKAVQPIIVADTKSWDREGEKAIEKVRERRLQVLTKRQRESVIVRKKQRERESNCWVDRNTIYFLRPETDEEEDAEEMWHFSSLRIKFQTRSWVGWEQYIRERKRERETTSIDRFVYSFAPHSLPLPRLETIS